MKKFLGKKSSDRDDDPNRNALFGSRGPKGPQSENPYAQASSDQYTEDNTKYAGMTRYQKARAGLEDGPGPQGLSRNDSSASSATAPPPYSDQAAPSGYGNNRYAIQMPPVKVDMVASAEPTVPDANRDALFSGARDRYQQQAAATDNSGNAGGGYGSNTGTSDRRQDGYGSQRELTEEEREAEEYRSLKDQIHKTTQESLNTTQNSLRYMNQALDTGLATYARLGAQNERLHHTDQLLDTATESHRQAEAQTKKLKSLNRSMFAVHVSNPFTEKRRTAEEEARILQQNQSDREIRETTRRDKLLEDDSDEESKAQLDAANEQIERGK
ncbi:hypothetical protein ONZ43_g2979 [Nemania bipapillata]|uniref:Uncharacterized protein n=1 Tax=Nemania bipapillata TaxID=110536 RepID=A0ACC2IYR9_9PEZI|nr:hypothetical protein ONZ43_g2979 [Nemania bipapillata]